MEQNKIKIPQRWMAEILWKHRRLVPPSGSIDDMGPYAAAVIGEFEALYQIEAKTSSEASRDSRAHALLN